MAPKRKPSSPISIGNCEVTVEATRFTCNSDSNAVVISLPRSGKVKVSAAVVENHENASEDFRSGDKEHEFVLVNPKDADSVSKSYLQEVLEMYRIELPGMNYAANTGKQSKFLERCVTNGSLTVLSSRKYRTLLVKSTRVGNSGKVIAAITYQIIPADTEFAEVPLAAVNAIHQRKGFGHLLVLELRKRLQSVGIRSILCWGDKESEGFWLKQGFVEIAQVDTKGRARRLPVKADIQKSLCFLGGSTLMVCHVMKECLADEDNTTKCLPSQFHQNSFTPAIAEDEQLKISGSDSRNPKKFCSSIAPFAQVNDDRQATGSESSQHGVGANVNYCSQSTKGAKRTWEASLSSLKSKRVKGSQLVDNQSGSSCGFILETDESNPCFVEALYDPSIRDGSEKCVDNYLHLEAPINMEPPSTKQCFRIMLMNIADDAKKTQLTKVIEDLGGTVSTCGSMTTHVVTGKVISRVEKVKETSTTIFVTGEEDTEEAMVAAKKGIRTFSCDWFMNCVMRQELDLEAPQFAETL
ncbi:uncharacterized protein HKW66_Vig0048450 [Vigna angularis]|uniref:BRCT domain-containing protein n=1 Tax=Phaseolus angularis TaxID=3914 RepID=A0A8T0KYY8_PHAAN|nr:uncharacterized protein HKW66_Vig0048450 [Vigna angularis]